MDNLWKGIAITGIWIGVAIMCKYVDGAAPACMPAAIATIFIAFAP